MYEWNKLNSLPSPLILFILVPEIMQMPMLHRLLSFLRLDDGRESNGIIALDLPLQLQYPGHPHSPLHASIGVHIQQYRALSIFAQILPRFRVHWDVHLATVSNEHIDVGLVPTIPDRGVGDGPAAGGIYHLDISVGGCEADGVWFACERA